VVLTNKDVETFASRSALEKIMQQVLNAHGKVSLCFLIVKLMEEVQLAVARDFGKMCRGIGMFLWYTLMHLVISVFPNPSARVQVCRFLAASRCGRP
jgi:hypothetical protein